MPVACVVETLRPLPVEPLAGAPAFVDGVAVLRGAATPVVRLARLLGTESDEAPGRFVTLRLGDRRVALAVDGVLGTRVLDALGGGLPPLLGQVAVGVIEQLAVADGHLLAVLEATRLIPETVWAGLAAGGAAQ